MKNLLAVIPLLISVCLFGQSDQSSKKSITLNINSIGELPSTGLGNIHYDKKYLNGGDEKDKSFSLGINGDYFIKDEIALRIKGVYTKRKYEEYRDTRDIQTSNPANARRIDNLSITESDLSLAFGIYYQYQKSIFVIYSGFELEYIYHTKTKLIDIVSNTAQLLSDNYVLEDVITVPDGNSFGVGGFIGSKLFSFKDISVGLEFSSALLYTKIGNTVNLKDRVISGSPSLNFDDAYRDSIKRFGFTEVRTSLNVSYWF